MKRYVIAVFTVGLIGMVWTAEGMAQHEQLAVRLVEEAYNNRNLGVIDDLVAPGYASHVNGVRADGEGPDLYKKGVLETEATYPDFEIEINAMVAAGDYVTTRWTLRGTHAESDRPMAIQGITLSRFEDGKVAESWMAYDAP